MENDDIALDELGQLCDLSYEIRVSHYLYFSRLQSAEAIAAAARTAGFQAGVEPGALGNDWRLLLVHDIIINKETLSRTRLLMLEWANSQAGEYDGWEADLTHGRARSL